MENWPWDHLTPVLGFVVVVVEVASVVVVFVLVAVVVAEALLFAAEVVTGCCCGELAMGPLDSWGFAECGDMLAC